MLFPIMNGEVKGVRRVCAPIFLSACPGGAHGDRWAIYRIAGHGASQPPCACLIEQHASSIGHGRFHLEVEFCRRCPICCSCRHRVLPRRYILLLCASCSKKPRVPLALYSFEGLPDLLKCHFTRSTDGFCRFILSSAADSQHLSRFLLTLDPGDLHLQMGHVARLWNNSFPTHYQQCMLSMVVSFTQLRHVSAGHACSQDDKGCMILSRQHLRTA